MEHTYGSYSGNGAAEYSAPGPAVKRRKPANTYLDPENQSYWNQSTTSRTQAKQLLLQQQQLLAEQQAAALAAANGSGRNGGMKKDEVHIPILSLATLPPASLQKYLSRYNLLEPSGTLSYHHAVFPVPPLPSILTPPLLRRTSVSASAAKRSKPRHTLNSVIDPVGGRMGGFESRNTSGRSTPMTVLSNGEKSSTTTATGEGTELPGTAPGVMGEGKDGVVNDTGSLSVPTETREKRDSSASAKPRLKRRPSWHEPKTAEFANLTAYDEPGKVLERWAKRAKTHWDMRESVKEGETLTNFIFALRMRDKTLRATPPG